MDKYGNVILCFFFISIIGESLGHTCNFTIGSRSDSWRLSDVISVTFDAESMTLFDSQDSIVSQYTCEGETKAGEFAPTEWLYHVVSDSEGRETCLRLYVTDTLIVFWQSPPNGIIGTNIARSSGSLIQAESSSLLAVDCREIVAYSPPPSILLKENIDLSSSDCFAPVPGLYQVVYDSGEGPQCEGDLASVAEIVSDEIVINSCYSGDNERLPLQSWARVKCAGPVEAAALDDPWTETAVVLEYTNSKQSVYYCARIYIDMSRRRFQMSLDYTPRTDGLIKCEQGVNARLTEPDPVLQPELVGLDFLAIEFTPADCELGVCLNGATCTQLFGRPSYRCTCAQGYSGDTCEVYDACAGPMPPCENGATCFFVEHDVYTCECPTNYTGINCQSLVEICVRVADTCDNGGTCVSVDDYTFNCTCTLPFAGALCQTELIGCQLDGCENGGTCHDNGTCDCSEFHSGERCESFLTESEEGEELVSPATENKKKKNDLIVYIVLIPIFLGLALIFLLLLCIYLVCCRRRESNDGKLKQRSSILWYNFRPIGPRILNRSSKAKGKFNHDRPRLKTIDEQSKDVAVVASPVVEDDNGDRKPVALEVEPKQKAEPVYVNVNDYENVPNADANRNENDSGESLDKF